jgi:hypothetical protein
MLKSFTPSLEKDISGASVFVIFLFDTFSHYLSNNWVYI